ncbi:unnamed protein product [Pedinophyceae sp. YPF-701]|nr:unnamed protein product [Pedinophyceae sp. YPF-701]
MSYSSLASLPLPHTASTAVAKPPAGSAPDPDILSPSGALRSSLPPRGDFKPVAGAPGYKFEYPSSWLLAYDRSNADAVGSQVLAGNFKDVATVSVSRVDVLADVLHAIDGNPAAIAQFLSEEPRRSTGTIRLEDLYQKEVAKDTVEFEYVVETCRGNVEEQAGGRVACLGPRNMELQTITRHFRCVAIKRPHADGAASGTSLYVLSASAPQETWERLAPTMERVVRSYGFA